jgi:exosortase K
MLPAFNFQFSVFSFQFVRKLSPMTYQLSLIPKIKIGPAARLCFAVAVAFALKLFFSNAAVDDLRWILAPTTFLVETVTGRTFTFESHAGYMSADHTFLIAASCSGVNFLIIAFLMLVVGKFWREANIEWRFLPAAMLIAYIATLLANTLRIVIALSIRDLNFELSWITPEGLHRLEGVIVYFGSLLVLFVSSETFARRSSVISLARRSVIPLGIYYAVTLGVPIAGGAYTDIDFWKHAIVVIIAPLIVILPLVIFSFARSSELGEDLN